MTFLGSFLQNVAILAALFLSDEPFVFGVEGGDTDVYDSHFSYGPVAAAGLDEDEVFNFVLVVLGTPDGEQHEQLFEVVANLHNIHF